MTIPYFLIRSKRRTLALQIHTSWDIVVRSPMRTSLFIIEDFINQKIDWIEKHQRKIQEKTTKKILTDSEIKIQIETLRLYIIPRVYEFWEWKNLPKITSIKITKSEGRWGSCSGKNWLCFSYRLFEYIDTPFIDAIIMHELCHLREKNHQKPFWNLVYSWMPDYKVKIASKK